MFWQPHQILLIDTTYTLSIWWVLLETVKWTNLVNGRKRFTDVRTLFSMRIDNTCRFLANRFDVPGDQTAVCAAADKLFSLIMPTEAGELLRTLIHLLLKWCQIFSMVANIFHDTPVSWCSSPRERWFHWQIQSEAWMDPRGFLQISYWIKKSGKRKLNLWRK